MLLDELGGLVRTKSSELPSSAAKVKDGLSLADVQHWLPPTPGGKTATGIGSSPQLPLAECPRAQAHHCLHSILLSTVSAPLTPLDRACVAPQFFR